VAEGRCFCQHPLKQSLHELSLVNETGAKQFIDFQAIDIKFLHSFINITSCSMKTTIYRIGPPKTSLADHLLTTKIHFLKWLKLPYLFKNFISCPFFIQGRNVLY
jgi:hypothetical protein